MTIKDSDMKIVAVRVAHYDIAFVRDVYSVWERRNGLQIDEAKQFAFRADNQYRVTLKFSF